MPKFQVGDSVEWTRIIVPAGMRRGTVVRVIPRPELPGDLNEYDVRFRFQTVRFYERQLRPARSETASPELFPDTRKA
jgi:hypothetical protein